MSALNVLADLGFAEFGIGGTGNGQTGEGGLIEAMNKLDLLDNGTRASLGGQKLRNSETVAVSAITGEGCEALLAVIDRRLESSERVIRLEIPLTDGKTLAWVYRRGEVLGRRDDDQSAHLSVRLSAEDIARLHHRQRLH
jgi:GTP-binding protein HflX